MPTAITLRCRRGVMTTRAEFCELLRFDGLRLEGYLLRCTARGLVLPSVLHAASS